MCPVCFRTGSMITQPERRSSQAGQRCGDGARMLAEQIEDRSLRASALYETCAEILRNTRQTARDKSSKPAASPK